MSNGWQVPNGAMLLLDYFTMAFIPWSFQLLIKDCAVQPHHASSNFIMYLIWILIRQL